MKKIYFLTFVILPLFLSAQIQKLPPVVEWQKTLGGSKGDKAYSVVPTIDHGFLVVGNSFSNDGLVTGHHGTTDSSDAWVVKLNKSGDVEWQKSYGGSNTDEFKHAVQTANGDFICVGTTRSIDGDVTGLHTGNGVASDLWVVRIDRYGAIKWSKVYGGSSTEHGTVIRKMWDGNYMIGGDAQSNDFDVTGNHGSADIWILKIDDQGNLLWQKTFGNPNSQFVSSLTATSDNNYLISGYQIYTGYGNQTMLPVYSYYERAAVKIDAQGNTLWEQYPLFTPGNPGTSHFSSRILELPGHNLFEVGSTVNTISLPSWSFSRLDNSSGTSLQLFNAAAGTLSISDYTTPLNAGPDAVQILSDSSILACLTANGRGATINRINTQNINSFQIGFFYQNSDVSGNFNSIIALQDDEYIAAGSNGLDFIVVKYKARNQIKGKVFVDNNSNGVKDSNEPYFNRGIVVSQKNGSTISSALDTSGSFLNLVDSGTYTTSLTLEGKQYYTINPVNRQSVFTTFNIKDSFAFALVPVPNKKDLEISLQALNTLRSGLDAQYRISYSNTGTVQIANASITFVKPSSVNFVSANPAPASVNADTITWNVGNMDPLTASSITLVLRAGNPPAVNIGDVMVFAANISPDTSDETPADNTDTIHQTVKGPFDPNDKIENNNGSFYVNQLQANQPLTYTIRFQNTGTDTAFNVVIKDTLSDQLDINSLELVCASHPGQLSIKDGKYCTWTFSDIHLPDSTTNEPASHGYISYRIKPKNTLQAGDVINNSASIYFDFNYPVLTNTQQTVIKNIPVPPPPQPGLTGLQAGYCSSQGTQKGKIINLPAAGSGITVTVKLDTVTLTTAADSSFSFAVTSLAAGTHHITVSFSNSSATQTTTADFTIMAAVTPDVNVSANITHITNLTDPVVITAVNAAGGGKAPLYTFAWNRTFTNIIQTGSSNNTLTVSPSSFAIGDNPVYVNMKTSETCYTSQTNIDSISIRRDQATGIVDPEMPGLVINVYPNPSNGPVTIDGLSSAKNYTITIFNLHGQVIYTKHVTNHSKVDISRMGDATGIYMISIYDDKKNRLLGSVKLIKQ